MNEAFRAARYLDDQVSFFAKAVRDVISTLSVIFDQQLAPCIGSAIRWHRRSMIIRPTLQNPNVSEMLPQPSLYPTSKIRQKIVKIMLTPRRRLGFSLPQAQSYSLWLSSAAEGGKRCSGNISGLWHWLPRPPYVWAALRWTTA